MNQDRLEYLFKQYTESRCTEPELDELNNWYHQLKGGRPDFEQWIKEAGGEEQLSAELYGRFTARLEAKTRPRRMYGWYAAAAAMILLALQFSHFFIGKDAGTEQVASVKIIRKAGAPGSNRAMLTLADGRRVDLDNAKQGTVASQGGVNIQKEAGGKLVYQSGATTPAQEKLMAYNTIATPRAGQYELVLPDGTKVWLNAETSLRYPVKFTGNERRVELTGEAYFEVAHNKNMPFRVTTAEQTVTVLGTHFNIKAYADEDQMETTLLEGSVSIANKISGQRKMLAPGKQANVQKGEGSISITGANTEQVMAWKNGYFIFDNTDIRSIMKLISRWYDVDVSYKLTRTVRLGGTFSKSSNLDQLLKSFAELSNANFDLKERRIIVSN